MWYMCIKLVYCVFLVIRFVFKGVMLGDIIGL